MRPAIVAVALLAACRGDHPPEPRDQPVAVASLVPHLPMSPDGAEELRALDKRIVIHDGEPKIVIATLLDRATYRGRLEDYQAALERSARLIADTPTDVEAFKLRTSALLAVHDFVGARASLARVQQLSLDRAEWVDQAATLDEASGARKRALIAHVEAAKAYPNPVTLTQEAASLALDGQLDTALALIPRAAKTIHDNSPELFAWLLFQWGRLYEQNGDLAAARQFYAQACTRLPGYLEATAHLAQTSIATGDTAGAKRVVAAALADNRQPVLLELAAQLGLAPVADARAEWERYVAALPLAFADHAARFYLGVGADPKRALALAAQNLANRDVPEARALVVEAALAAGDNTAACAAVGPLVAAPQRAHRFMAWRALVACGRSADADRLAKELGISP